MEVVLPPYGDPTEAAAAAAELDDGLGTADDALLPGLGMECHGLCGLLVLDPAAAAAAGL